ncbi:hypothetical protein [Burkholderia vietnamiensis]|uniref:hypothetical protein n=1 Tax=Burkholderia vietnamiensis TaxID=60552 RepID=UPI000ACF7F9F|nr:hypothetical protein [Burkholderia vietnamiensis]MCA7985252.1 hypothetical protein [Burkholderia vietnamiensis]HDR8933007.1 hypothetical protein [Burkholderia vietnamiensis]
MTTDNEKGPLNQMESGQEKRSASEARALSEIVNGTPSENLCRRGSPAPEQASETTAQQPRTYTTQPAESVMGIALRQCGNEMEWRHILACNPEFARMLPHEYFPVGTVLNLPPHPAAASRFEQPEKSLAPEGGSEARGRWIQANCPTGDIIKSPSPSNNREFPTSMSESDCEHRIALAPSQPAAAPLDKPSVNDTITFSGDSLTLSGAQLLEALDFIAPDRDADQLESEVTIQYGEGHTGKGMYCWCTEYPEEGAIFIDGSTAVPAAPAPSPADERAAFEWPLLPLLPETVITTADGEAVFTAHQMQGYANAYGEMVRAHASAANETGAEGAKTEAEIRKTMTPDQIRLERKLTCEAIDGAMALGYQNTNPPPSADHWLAPYWHVGRKQAELESRSPAMAAEAAAIVDETDAGLFVEILYGENGSSLKLGDKLYAAPQPAQADARIDVEAMLRACVPGGDICDPQRIADSIREWFDEHGQNAAQAVARVGLTDEQREAIEFVIGWYGQSTIADNPYREHIAALRALLQGADHA